MNVFTIVKVNDAHGAMTTIRSRKFDENDSGRQAGREPETTELIRRPLIVFRQGRTFCAALDDSEMRDGWLGALRTDQGRGQAKDPSR